MPTALRPRRRPRPPLRSRRAPPPQLDRKRALASATDADFATPAAGGPLLPPIFGKLVAALCLRFGNPAPNPGESSGTYWQRLCAMYEQMPCAVCTIDLIDLLEDHYKISDDTLAALTAIAYQNLPPETFRTTTAAIVQQLDAARVTS